jgi:hypothetical protein
MKQNPKIKQNALHTYITYMIYNDKLHGNNNRMVSVIVCFFVCVLYMLTIYNN